MEQADDFVAFVLSKANLITNSQWSVGYISNKTYQKTQYNPVQEHPYSLQSPKIQALRNKSHQVSAPCGL